SQADGPEAESEERCLDARMPYLQSSCVRGWCAVLWAGMAHHQYDKSSKWLIQKHGNGILYLGGIRHVRAWRALQAELVQPSQLPDGLLEVFFHGRSTPDY